MDNHNDKLLIEVDEIKKMMDLLSNLFSIRTSFIYSTIDDDKYINEIAGNNGDYQSFCKLIQLELKHKCVACDRDMFKEANSKQKPVLYQCYNGLYEMFLPLFIENSLAGYLHFGQVRSEKDFRTILTECSLYEHTQVDKLEETYNSMNIITKEKLLLISELFQKFADIILKNRLIELRKAKPEYFLKKYIIDNLTKPIDVETAAAFICRSPSYVTHNFKEKYNMSFHQYLTLMRVEHAKTLLKNNPISDVFELCGFKNRYHFSKVFKKIEGITPYEYKMKLENI